MLLLTLAPSPAFAHEGHDHGAATKPAALPQLAPRFEAASELFEVVGVAGSDGLTLWLDRFADNWPVAGARIEVDGVRKGLAREVAPAVYRLEGTALPPGRHEVTLTIVAGDDSDLLAAQLEIAAPAAENRPAAVGGGRLALVGSLLLALGMLVAVGWRWRRRRAA